MQPEFEFADNGRVYIQQMWKETCIQSCSKNLNQGSSCKNDLGSNRWKAETPAEPNDRQETKGAAVVAYVIQNNQPHGSQDLR